MSENCGLILKLLEQYNEQSSKELQCNPTFLKTIGRSYDEDLISRIIAYILLVDKKVFESIVRFYLNYDVSLCKVISVECEKSMCGGRVDIFAIAEDQVGNKYTLTIENKIFTWEHDDQTKTYFRFVTNQNEYKKCKNAFIYLKPDFNVSEPICDAFKTLTYGKLFDFIENINNTIICDFKRHINEYLKNNEVKMMDTDLIVLKNYKTLRKIMNSAELIFENCKQSLAKVIFKNEKIRGLNYNPFDKNDVASLKRIPDGTLVVENGGKDSFRIYRKGKWWHNDNDYSKKYYFYVELKFADNDPNEILVQQTIKRYGSNHDESVVVKFVKELTADQKYSGQWEYKRWYAIRKERFHCEDYEIFTEEWQNALANFAIEKIPGYIKEMDDIFSKFEMGMYI